MFQKNYLRTTLAAGDEVSPPEFRKDYVNLTSSIISFLQEPYRYLTRKSSVNTIYVKSVTGTLSRNCASSILSFNFSRKYRQLPYLWTIVSFLFLFQPSIYFSFSSPGSLGDLVRPLRRLWR